MHAVDFKLKPSRLYLFIFSAIVITSLIILFTLPVPLWLRLLGMVLVVVHSGRVIWRYVLLRDRLSITDIRYTIEKRWVVQTKESAFVAELQGNSTVTSYVLLLHFRIAGKMLPLKSIIFRDSLSQEDFHQLLLRLRLLS